MSIDLLVYFLSKTRLETQLDLFAWYSWICREKEKMARWHYRKEIASFEAQHFKRHNTNRRVWTQSSFPSKIFDAKFNSQATLRKAGSFTVHAQIIFFLILTKNRNCSFKDSARLISKLLWSETSSIFGLDSFSVVIVGLWT